MVAKQLDNGIITTYNDYPQDKGTNDGYYPYIKPETDENEGLSPIFFDSVNNIFTHNVISVINQHPEQLFNAQVFMNSLLVKFWGNIISIDKLNTYINNCCNNRLEENAPYVMRVGFLALNNYMQAKKQAGFFTQTEFDIFYETMMEQNIDLASYVLPA